MPVILVFACILFQISPKNCILWKVETDELFDIFGVILLLQSQMKEFIFVNLIFCQNINEKNW